MSPAAPLFSRRPVSPRSCRSERWRRAFVWAATIWFAFVTSGVPLPAGMRAEWLGSAFPCMHHACGCRSAAACWADCCCYTEKEKLSWARANGVNPPAGTPLFDPETKKAIADESTLPEPSEKRSCCSTKAKGIGVAQIACNLGRRSRQESRQVTCDDVRPDGDRSVDSLAADAAQVDEQPGPPEKDVTPALEAPVRACCSAKREEQPKACCGSSSENENGDESAPAGIAILQAMKCRGVASSWTGTGEPFVAPCEIEWSPEIAVSAALPAEEPLFVARRLRYLGPPG